MSAITYKSGFGVRQSPAAFTGRPARPGAATTAPPSPRRRSGPARRRARGRFGPGGPKRRESAPTIPEPATGGLLCARWGGHFRERFLGPSALGRTRAGSRYQCAVAGATAVRRSFRPARRRARAASGRAGRSGERERAPLPIPRRAGCFSLGGGHFCRRFLGASALGRTRGRVALPMRRRRRDGGPPLLSSRQAAGSGPLLPGRAEAGGN